MTRLQIDDIVANMAESLDDLSETPRRIILSGEGLKRMDVRVFKGLVRNLGRLGIEVEDLDMGSGEVEEPRIISKHDFMRAARERDLSKVSTGKTWHALTEPRRKFSRAQDKLVSGARLYSWERESLYIPQWQVELSVS